MIHLQEYSPSYPNPKEQKEFTGLLKMGSRIYVIASAQFICAHYQENLELLITFPRLCHFMVL